MFDSVSLFDMIIKTSIFIKIIMVLLVLLSTASWVIIIRYWIVISINQRNLVSFEDSFWNSTDINKFYKKCCSNAKITSIEQIFISGLREFGRMYRNNSTNPKIILESTQRAMRITISRETISLERHLPLLATIGSTSPYIGLLGTVCGIIHSFQKLSYSDQATNIMLVVPGISEALIVTAMGLISAIPAIIFYNRFISQVDDIMDSLHIFTEELNIILHRQVYQLNRS